MPSLLDIAPAVERLTIRGVDLEVRGVGLEDIARVLGETPELRDALTNIAAVNPVELLRRAPGAIHTLIAIATGSGEPEEVAAAAALPFGDQVTLTEAIMRLSFPGGLLPFVDKLTAMLGVLPATPLMTLQ